MKTATMTRNTGNCSSARSDERKLTILPARSKLGHRVNVAALFATALGILTLPACSGLIRKPEPGIVIEDDASICISSSQLGEITASIKPADCYSYRKYLPQRQTGVAVINEQAHSIRFHSTFVLQPIRSIFPQTPDCEGGGQISLNLGLLNGGIYEVFSGERSLGKINLLPDLPWCSEEIS